MHELRKRPTQNVPVRLMNKQVMIKPVPDFRSI